MSGWRLITGTTGLLGQYLLCEALENRDAIAVLTRSLRGVSATERINRIIALWEKRRGVLLQRPVVLEGDLRSEGVQLSDADAHWFRQNVTCVLHNAASVRFQESSTGEPMKSNVEGTRNLLDLCKNSHVREFHYISTAYSCGRVDRTAPVYEKLHSKTGPFGNVYEQSKCISEHLVVEAAGDFTRTIYRPSIIIGESATGYSPSFNAIYTPLRLGWMLLNESPGLVRSEDVFLEQIGAHGSEERNLVPVDWVSNAVTSMMRQSSCHGRIYHLTNPVQTEGREILTAMVQAAGVHMDFEKVLNQPPEAAAGKMDLAGFRQHMEAYRSYFQTDPQFDNSQFRAAAVCPPCPQLDRETLARVFEYAIRVQFQDADQAVDQRPANEPCRQLENLMNRQAFDASQGNLAQGFRLKLSGAGGGCWWISTDPGGARSHLPDSEDDDVLQIYASAAAFHSWRQGEYSFQEGLSAGLFIVTGPPGDQQRAAQFMLDLRNGLQKLSGINARPFAADPFFVPHNALATGTDL